MRVSAGRVWEVAGFVALGFVCAALFQSLRPPPTEFWVSDVPHGLLHRPGYRRLFDTTSEVCLAPGSRRVTSIYVSTWPNTPGAGGRWEGGMGTAFREIDLWAFLELPSVPGVRGDFAVRWTRDVVTVDGVEWTRACLEPSPWR